MEIRRNPDGSIDEIVGTCTHVQLEQLDEDDWCLTIDHAGGQLIIELAALDWPLRIGCVIVEGEGNA